MTTSTSASGSRLVLVVLCCAGLLTSAGVTQVTFATLRALVPTKAAESESIPGGQTQSEHEELHASPRSRNPRRELALGRLLPPVPTLGCSSHRLQHRLSFSRFWRPPAEHHQRFGLGAPLRI